MPVKKSLLVKKRFIAYIEGGLSLNCFAMSKDHRLDKPRSKDPLEGVTLEALLTELVTQYGWEHLGQQVPIRCFQVNPSVKSSLTFLRRTPWARSKVENLYREWKTKSSYER